MQPYTEFTDHYGLLPLAAGERHTTLSWDSSEWGNTQVQPMQPLHRGRQSEAAPEYFGQRERSSAGRSASNEWSPEDAVASEWLAAALPTTAFLAEEGSRDEYRIPTQHTPPTQLIERRETRGPLLGAAAPIIIPSPVTFSTSAFTSQRGPSLHIPNPQPQATYTTQQQRTTIYTAQPFPSNQGPSLAPRAQQQHVQLTASAAPALVQRSVISSQLQQPQIHQFQPLQQQRQQQQSHQIQQIQQPQSHQIQQVQQQSQSHQIQQLQRPPQSHQTQQVQQQPQSHQIQHLHQPSQVQVQIHVQRPLQLQHKLPHQLQKPQQPQLQQAHQTQQFHKQQQPLSTPQSHQQPSQIQTQQSNRLQQPNRTQQSHHLQQPHQTQQSHVLQPQQTQQSHQPQQPRPYGGGKDSDWRIPTRDTRDSRGHNSTNFANAPIAIAAKMPWTELKKLKYSNPERYYEIQKFRNEKRLLDRTNPRVFPFYCETCDKPFKTQEAFDVHCSGHLKCEFEGCNFLTSKEHLLNEHIVNYHVQFRAPADPEEYARMRVKNYPTRENIKKKELYEIIRFQRGDILQKEEREYQQSKRQQHRDLMDAKSKRMEAIKEIRQKKMEMKQRIKDGLCEAQEGHDEVAKTIDEVLEEDIKDSKQRKLEKFQRLNRRKKQKGLLARLLKTEIKKDHRKLLQCLRFFRATQWLTTPPDWSIAAAPPDPVVEAEKSDDESEESSTSEEE